MGLSPMLKILSPSNPRQASRRGTMMKKVLGKMGCKTHTGTIVCRGRWNLARYQM